MNTKHFDYIIAIAEARSLSGAAKRLGVSQPVLSRYLSSLEEQLGVKLFVQDKRRLHITAAGQIYLNGVRRMKDLQSQMHRAFDALRGEEELKLKIGMSPFFGGQELAYIYPHLLNRYPNLDLQIAEGASQELLEQLRKKKLTSLLNLYDAALMPGTKVASLAKKEIFLALPSYHPLAGGVARSKESAGRISLEQFKTLANVPFVYLGSGTIMGLVLDRMFKDCGFSPLTLLRSNNSITVDTLLGSGSYAGFSLQDKPDVPNLTYFRLPTPLYLYSGMIFLEEYQPSEAECFLYRLECQEAATKTPKSFQINDYGRRLLALAGNRQEE